MKINIKAQHTTVTPALAEYLEKRLNGLAKFSGRSSDDVSIDVDIEVTSHHHHAGAGIFLVKANLNVGDMHIHAEATDQDMYAAIDGLKNELMRELVSKKKKRTNLVRWGGQKIKEMVKKWSDSDAVGPETGDEEYEDKDLGE